MQVNEIDFFLRQDLNANGASAGKRGTLCPGGNLFFVHVLFGRSYCIYMCTHVV